MKNDRQKAILEIISAQNIETQEELGALLQQRGYKVTQATISRDIKELHLIKVQAEPTWVLGPLAKFPHNFRLMF